MLISISFALDISISSGSEKKGHSFVLKCIHRLFFSLVQPFFFSCLWSISHLGPCPTELMQAWQIPEINGNSAGEQGKLGNAIFVILPFAPWSICQKFLNTDPNTLLWILWAAQVSATSFLKCFQPDNDLLRHPPTSGPPMPQWNILKWQWAWTLFPRLKFQIRNIRDSQFTWEACTVIQTYHFLLHNFNPKLAHLRRKVVI